MPEPQGSTALLSMPCLAELSRPPTSRRAAPIIRPSPAATHRSLGREGAASCRVHLPILDRHLEPHRRAPHTNNQACRGLGLLRQPEPHETKATIALGYVNVGDLPPATRCQERL